MQPSTTRPTSTGLAQPPASQGRRNPLHQHYRAQTPNQSRLDRSMKRLHASARRWPRRKRTWTRHWRNIKRKWQRISRPQKEERGTMRYSRIRRSSTGLTPWTRPRNSARWMSLGNKNRAINDRLDALEASMQKVDIVDAKLQEINYGPAVADLVSSHRDLKYYVNSILACRPGPSGILPPAPHLHGQQAATTLQQQRPHQHPIQMHPQLHQPYAQPARPPPLQLQNQFGQVQFLPMPPPGPAHPGQPPFGGPNQPQHNLAYTPQTAYQQPPPGPTYTYGPTLGPLSAPLPGAQHNQVRQLQRR